MAGSFPARALTTTSEEKLAIWAIMAKIRPAYQEWQTRRDAGNSGGDARTLSEEARDPELARGLGSFSGAQHD